MKSVLWFLLVAVAFCATASSVSSELRGERADLDFVTDAIYRYADETPDRHLFPDWHWTNNSRVRGFLERSVIGGLFMPMLAYEWSVK